MKNIKYAFLVLILSQFQYAISCDSNDLEEKDAALRSAIYLTSYNNNTDAVKALLDEGANPSSQDTDGKTILNTALSLLNININVVEMLVQAGVDLSIQDKRGKTALHLAAEKGNIAVTEILLAAGAPLDIQDNDGNTPLHSATNKLYHANGRTYPRPDPNEHNPPYYEIIENMVQKGADGNIQNNTDETPLYIAVSHADYTAVKILLKATNLEIRDPRRGSELARSITLGYDSFDFDAPNDNYKLITQLLLDNGANPNTKGEHYPPLSVAAIHSNVDAVKALLNANADPNTADKDRQIPLYATLRMFFRYDGINASVKTYVDCFAALLSHSLYKKNGHLLCSAQPDKDKNSIIDILNAFESEDPTQEEIKIREAYPALSNDDHIPFLDALNEVMNAQVATLPNHKIV